VKRLHDLLACYIVSSLIGHHYEMRNESLVALQRDLSLHGAAAMGLRGSPGNSTSLAVPYCSLFSVNIPHDEGLDTGSLV
jgi:hypothetical protein